MNKEKIIMFLVLESMVLIVSTLTWFMISIPTAYELRSLHGASTLSYLLPIVMLIIGTFNAYRLTRNPTIRKSVI